jgi:hypothetical protein
MQAILANTGTKLFPFHRRVNITPDPDPVLIILFDFLSHVITSRGSRSPGGNELKIEHRSQFGDLHSRIFLKAALQYTQSHVRP